MCPTYEGAGRPDPPLPSSRGVSRATAGFGQSGYDEHLEGLEVRLLLEALADRYGYDFRDYEEQFIRSRIHDLLAIERLPTVTALIEKLLHDSRAVDRFIAAFSAEPAPLFDSPAAYAALRRSALPELRSCFFVRAWQVGCTTGERAYALAILLEEEGLGEKSRVYVTDLNGAALRKARQGLFPLPVIQSRRAHYVDAGGRGSLEDHYTQTFDSALISPTLRRNMVFAQHNLVTDASFNEFQLIVCRDVLKRFNATLQARVLGLLHESLAQGGFLLLSPGETPRIGTRVRDYAVVDESAGLYRKLT